jgi:YidC/Oxa1 family membrane protein insertase
VGNPLDPIYDAVAWVVNHVYSLLTPVFGASSGWTFALTIVIIVVLMRLIMVPLFIKQMHTTRAMMKLQPQMMALRKKYKNDKQTLNQEMMKLYQEAGVNPLMGCLPVVLQLPMFFALYSVLKAIAEWTTGEVPRYGLHLDLVRNAQHASIFGATVADKFLFSSTTPLHAKIVIIIAVIVSMTTTFLSVRQSMKRGMMPSATPDNPMAQSQKMMVYIMPLFALSGLYWPFGLVLYWVTTNMWTLGQQFVLFKLYPYTPPVAADAEAAAGTAAGKGAPAAGPGATGGGRPKGSLGSAGGRRRGAQADGNGQAAGSVPLVSQQSANGGGVLRRLGRRAEPAPQPAPEPEVKLVRQQRQRQSRSKRSGKR